MRTGVLLCLLPAAAAVGAALLLGSSCSPANRAPSVPTVTGPFTGAYDIIFFRATSHDPDGDPIAFQFEWGDTTTARWSSFVASGDTLLNGHNYSDSGTYLVKVRTRDTTGRESDWCMAETVRTSGEFR